MRHERTVNTLLFCKRSATIQVNNRREYKCNDTNLKCALAGVSFPPHHWTGVSGEKSVEGEVHACWTAWGTSGTCMVSVGVMNGRLLLSDAIYFK